LQPLLSNQKVKTVSPDPEQGDAAKFFKEAEEGIEYLSTTKDLLGVEVLKTAKFGTEALSGLTGGLYKTGKQRTAEQQKEYQTLVRKQFDEKATEKDIERIEDDYGRK